MTSASPIWLSEGRLENKSPGSGWELFTSQGIHTSCRAKAGCTTGSGKGQVFGREGRIPQESSSYSGWNQSLPSVPTEAIHCNVFRRWSCPECHHDQAEGDTEAAELLAAAFAKVRQSLLIFFWQILWNGMTWMLRLHHVAFQAGEGLVELRRIEAAEDIANNMAQSRNVVYLPQVPCVWPNIEGIPYNWA